jgi:hypothetical protein
MANTREHRYAVSLIWNGNLGTGTSSRALTATGMSRPGAIQRARSSPLGQVMTSDANPGSKSR